MKLHERAFQLLVFALPVQLGLHLWPNWAFVFGIRIDYLSPTIFATDILVAFLVLTARRQILSQLKSKAVLFALIILFTTILLNTFFSTHQLVTFIKWAKLLEVGVLAVYTASLGKSRAQSLFRTPLALALIFSSTLAVLQFVNKGSIGGILYWTGERSFKLSTPGIAKGSFLGTEVLRPYATFPHPNALAGFSLVSLVLLLEGGLNTKLMKLAFFFSVATILISQSLGAIVAAAVISVFTLAHKTSKEILLPFFYLMVLLSLVFPLAGLRLIKDMTLADFVFIKRLEMAVVAGDMFSKTPIVGVGFGTYILNLMPSWNALRTQLSHNFTWWLQPVHNIMLLVLAETGLLGLMLFLVATISSLKRALSEKKYFFTLSLLTIFLTGLFDHYWLTTQQPLLLMGLTFGTINTKP